MGTIISIVSLTLFIFLIGAFIISGFVKIPVASVGQVTKLGKRIDGKYKEEGWNFLPFYPFVYSIILIDMKKITFTVIIERALTPDRTSSVVPVMVTIRPIKKLLSNYIDSKQENGVKEQLSGKIQEGIREWCSGKEEGPSDWTELNESKAEGTSILIKKIARNSITEVPNFAQDIPTWIWLLYFSQPRPKKFQKNEKDWADKDWKIITDALATYTSSEVDELKIAIRERRLEVNNLRNGIGTIEIEDLGILIERLNIGDINVLGEVAKYADMEAKEEQERLGEAKEIKFVLERISEFMASPYNYTAEQALEAVQTERGKVTKTITENKLNISPETRGMVEKTLSPILLKIFNQLNP